MIRLKPAHIRMLDLVAAGHNVREIAQIEGKDESTVMIALYRLRRRVGIPSEPRKRGALREWCANNGWDVSEHVLHG